MDKLLKQIEDSIIRVIQSAGIKKEVFDKLLITSGWIILAYVILVNVNKNRKSKQQNEGEE